MRAVSTPGPVPGGTGPSFPSFCWSEHPKTAFFRRFVVPDGLEDSLSPDPIVDGSPALPNVASSTEGLDVPDDVTATSGEWHDVVGNEREIVSLAAKAAPVERHKHRELGGVKLAILLDLVSLRSPTESPLRGEPCGDGRGNLSDATFCLITRASHRDEALYHRQARCSRTAGILRLHQAHPLVSGPGLFQQRRGHSVLAMIPRSRADSCGYLNSLGDTGFMLELWEAALSTIEGEFARTRHR